MGNAGKFTRRGFIAWCASAATCLAARDASGDVSEQAEHHYPRAQLVAHDGTPVRARDLVSGRNYIFHYPYLATPCFLLNLDQQPSQELLHTENGATYRCPGGVGPKRSIVAYSAICAHKMTHPAQEVSFISYRDDSATFYDRDYQQQRRSGVIYCCSEKSVYDPAHGAAVLGGPAPQPLAAIQLEYDPDHDTLAAVATRGGEMFDRFFEKFGFRLALEYGTQDLRRIMTPTTAVVPLEEFSATRIRC